MKNWHIVKLRELLTESKIDSPNPNTEKRIRVKLNVGGVEKRPNTNDKEGATKYFIRKKGQFIYGKQNLHKGAFGIIPPELDGYESSSDIPAFDVNESCYPEWIFYFFKQGNFYLKLESFAKGVGSKRIQSSQLFELNIPLPDKNEQKKILDAVFVFEQRLLEISKEINLQFQLIFKLKQKFYHEAIQGSLTSKWRNENPNYESATDILKHLNQKKKELIRQKKIPNETPLPLVKKKEMPFNLPFGWAWCRFENILQSLRYGTSKKCDYNFGDTSVLRIPNIVDGKIDLNDLKSTNLNFKEKNDLALLENDLLIIRSNGSSSLVGRSAVVNSNAIGYSFAGYLMRARPFSEINANYIHIVFESQFIRELIEGSLRTTSGVKNINSSELYKLLVPLPSFSEQTVIADKIITLLNYISELKKEVEQNRDDLELLKQISLSQIFDNDYNNLGEILLPKRNKNSSNISILRLDNITILEKNDLYMELEQILREKGKMSAVNLWQMSKFDKDIDAFYAELKVQVEKKLIVESVEKGFLELAG